MKEEWRDVVGYKGRYQVSDLGRIKSIPFMQRYLLRNGAPANRRTKERLLAQQEINSGYLIAHLYLNNVRKAFLVHRVVAAAFIGDGEINHKNGVKTDNRLANLEIVTRTQNHLHAVALRLNRQAVPVINPRTGARYDSISQAARACHVSHRKVSATFLRADLCQM